PAPDATASPRLIASASGSWTAAELELRAVTRSRGRGARRRTVIDALEAALAPGRMTAITGRSGSGKTTLLRLLAGIDVPDSGDLSLDRQRLGRLGSQEPAPGRRAPG